MSRDPLKMASDLPQREYAPENFFRPRRSGLMRALRPSFVFEPVCLPYEGREKLPLVHPPSDSLSHRRCEGGRCLSLRPQRSMLEMASVGEILRSDKG